MSDDEMTLLGQSDAERLTDRIRNRIRSLQESLDRLGELIAEAYNGRAWEVLGYTDWDSYVREEFGVGRLRLTRNERRELVVGLRSTGMSTRAIGTALGVSDGTVRNDAGAQDYAPAPVTGLDGKSYEPRNPVQVQHSTTTTEKTVEVPVTVDADTGEVLDESRPSEAVSEFLDSDADLQRARYLHEFMKVLTRSDDFMEFDPEKLAGLTDREHIEIVENHLISVRNWTERFRAAVSGLRVVAGGKR